MHRAMPDHDIGTSEWCRGDALMFVKFSRFRHEYDLEVDQIRVEPNYTNDTKTLHWSCFTGESNRMLHIEAKVSGVAHSGAAILDK